MVEHQETPQAALATANRILAREGVLDAFGHVSLRDPADPGRFYLARSLAPELVTEIDVVVFDLSSQPVAPFDGALYSERVIHGAIYRARPDVAAICHHHASAVLPFCLTDLKLRVVTQLGATIGKQVPVWDQRDEFGATNHLVTREEEASSLAQCLGPHSIVIRPRQGGAGFKYTIPVSALAKLGPMNKTLDPRGRYDAVMAADGLFLVEPVQ